MMSSALAVPGALLAALASFCSPETESMVLTAPTSSVLMPSFEPESAPTVILSRTGSGSASLGTVRVPERFAVEFSCKGSPGSTMTVTIGDDEMSGECDSETNVLLGRRRATTPTLGVEAQRDALWQVVVRTITSAEEELGS